MPMLLRAVLCLPDHSLVCAVGAGGKTTLLHRLAAELARAGASVVCTTTTAIWQPYADVIVENDATALLDAVARQAARGRVIIAAQARRLERDEASGHERTKLSGVAADVPQRLLALPGVDHVLVEADGARGRALKAPAAHEPVLACGVTHVVAVAGIDALGQPLDARSAHRPERIGALLGVAPGTALNARHMATLLAHADGGRKGVPASARFIVFINKVDDWERRQAAGTVAACLRDAPGVDAVVIGALHAEQPVLETWP